MRVIEYTGTTVNTQPQKCTIIIYKLITLLHIFSIITSLEKNLKNKVIFFANAILPKLSQFCFLRYLAAEVIDTKPIPLCPHFALTYFVFVLNVAGSE